MNRLFVISINHLKFLLLFLFIGLGLNAFSQEVNVTGKVIDQSSNEPLPGVTVVVKGNPGVGTITDTNGNFQISVDKGSTLLFSFIGYATQSKSVSGTNPLMIALEQNIEELEELVIVGTVMKKSDLTGSVSRIASEELEEVPTSSVIQAMQGKVPGVYIQSNPAPGARASIKIRGNNSIQYGTNPIFVIDGLVIDGGFEMLNPEDIENIDILKDASATAIYGSRGANGVVVVTTKKGNKGEGKVTYDTWYGFQEFSKEMPLLNGAQSYNLRVDAYANAYIDKNPFANRENYIEKSLTNPNPIKNLIFSAEELESYVNGESYNWLNQITRSGFQQNHAASFSGGSDNGTYFMSFSYNDQEGQILNTNYKRYTGKVNLNQNVKSWLKVGTNTSFIYSSEQPVGNDNMFITALRASPLLPISDEYWYMREGKIDNQSSSNPLRDLTIDRDIYTNRLLTSNYLSVHPIEGLDIRTTFSVELNQNENYIYYPTTSTQSYKSTYDGQSIQTKSRSLNWHWDNSISYNKIIKEKNKISILVGSNTSFYGYTYNQQNASGYNNDLFSYKYSHGASEKEEFYLASDFSTYALQSYLARFNYSYNSKYYITLTGRYDGSSKFGPSNKWGFFPSIAGSWNITEESFMQNQQLFKNLRLRTGYGIAGNQNIPNYGYLTMYHPSISLDSNILTNGGRYGNPFLQWEKQKQVNAGLDVGMILGRLNITLDVFHILNEDLLMERSTAPSSGYLTKIDNVGALENKGIEFAVNASPVKTDKWHWDISLNVAADKNKITKLYGDVTEIYNLGGYSNNEIQREGNLFLGQPLNTIYVYKFDRIVQESDMEYVNSLELGSRIVKPGDILPLDKDNNSIINDLDRYVVGSKDPDFYGGASTSIGYGGLELNVNATYSVGAERISYLYETLINSTGTSGAHADLAYRWTPENTNTNIPRAYSDGGRFGLYEVDWSVQDASFFRLSEITLSYNIPKNILSPVKIANLRIYATGNNLFTFTNYKGYDPDSGDWYPSSKMYVIGMNIGF